MKTISIAVFATMVAQTYAVCPVGPALAAFDCIDWPEMDNAVRDHAGDYTWRFYSQITADGYKIKTFRFLADSNGDQVPDQWTKGPILLMNSVTNDCRDWFTESADPMADSIPKQLFDAGYDVWIGCSRGTLFSDEHETYAQGSEDYWDFNTGTIGRNDVP